MLRRLAAAGLGLLAAPLLAQEPAPALAPLPPTPPVAPAPHATVEVRLETSAGPITLSLEKERAPITTANFLRYVDAHRLDGTTIYRAVKVGEGFGLVQGGLRNDPKKLFPPIPLEPTSKTGLSHVSGAVSMARAGPNSATMDFFIVVGDLTSMDADPTKPGDNAGYAVFGHVADGMEVVKQILVAPTSATDGPTVMKGQMLVAPVRIVTARRVTAKP